MESTGQEPKVRVRVDPVWVLAAALAGYWIGQAWLLLCR